MRFVISTAWILDDIEQCAGQSGPDEGCFLISRTIQHSNTFVHRTHLSRSGNNCPSGFSLQTLVLITKWCWRSVRVRQADVCCALPQFPQHWQLYSSLYYWCIVIKACVCRDENQTKIKRHCGAGLSGGRAVEPPPPLPGLGTFIITYII